MKTQRKKHSRLWVYLLYLGLVTSLILSVTLARYVSSETGTGVATVAAMAGGGERISMLLDRMIPGGEAKTLKFQVVNHSGEVISEVAMDYDITVETTGNLPLTYHLTADEGPDRATGGDILQSGTSQILTGGAFPLTGEKQTHTYTLTVTWPKEKSEAGYADEIDLVTVTVEARQRLSGEGSSGL